MRRTADRERERQQQVWRIGLTQPGRRSSALEVRPGRRVPVELGRILRWPRPHGGQGRRIRPGTLGGRRLSASGGPARLALNAYAGEKPARDDDLDDRAPRTRARASTKPWRMRQPGNARAGVQRDAAQRSVYYGQESPMSDRQVCSDLLKVRGKLKIVERLTSVGHRRHYRTTFARPPRLGRIFDEPSSKIVPNTRPTQIHLCVLRLPPVIHEGVSSCGVLTSVLPFGTWAILSRDAWVALSFMRLAEALRARCCRPPW